MFELLQRNWHILISQPAPPPKATSDNDVVRFGLLGAAKIAPIALITPARQHPNVIVHAVAARDRGKAAAFAKKYGIGVVHGSYQELLDDPAIDAVYIPLPNGLHFEWALRSLAAGKHVLLEKPSANNAVEAELLFRSPLLLSPPAPILLEAFHYRFQPSWRLFLALLDQPTIQHASVTMTVPALAIPKDDIRFEFALGGGALMDLTYTMDVLRGVYGCEPTECTGCTVRQFPGGDERIDVAYTGSWRFPNGGTGATHGDLQLGLLETLKDPWPTVTVVHRPVAVDGDGSEETRRTRTVKLVNFVWGAIYHRIDIQDEFTIVHKRGDGTEEVVKKRWTKKETRKAHTLREAGIDRHSEKYWMTYKYQLDEFIYRIRTQRGLEETGIGGTGVWVDAEDSIAQARMIDMAYTKAGLPLRPTSTYRPV
ncbi:hypothetical protein QBC46DRAFT_293504 [Diplogelasinospora grovesii]|uniref:D-xylose 1-dehydrogenase (NADP(+), D-xylono-1,5-lactone-forming) n=1 Tax=Diplogelasinospora grovesii TaxID=303347 RepID=A0AAN6N3U4_9PEZI|nr:hypothetical protein QBC46DRAFT_293504 [Diplogelasinospora grovesii]